MINKIFTLIDLLFKWISKLFQECFSSYGPSVSSGGTLFNSHTEYGVHHVSRLGHSFQDSWLCLFLLFHLRLFNMKSLLQCGTPIDEF